MEQLEVAHMEIREVVETIQTKIQNASNVDELRIDARGERELIEQTIGNFAKVSANQLAGLKTRLNALVPVNRLPVELFVNIILLTSESRKGFYPYIQYTWVCHRWRSVIIQNSAFWTVIQHQYCHQPEFREPIYEEFLRRSKRAKLDIRLSSHSVPFISTLKKLFAEESVRICRLQIFGDDEDLIQLALSGEQFPSLQQLSIIDYSLFQDSRIPFTRLAPVFIASNCLETLLCSLDDDVPSDQLAPIFTRIRNLSLTIKRLAILPPVLEMLDNSAKLHALRLRIKPNSDHSEVKSLCQVVLPKLQFLSTTSFSIMKFFRAPNLSSLNSPWHPSLVSLPLKEFDFLPIRYLYIRGHRTTRKQCDADGPCVLGAKQRIACRSLFSQTTRIFHDEPFTHEYSGDCFHFDFGYGGTKFSTVLQGISMILPRLTSLVELYLIISHSLEDFDALLPHIPSIEKMVVKRGNKLLDVLRLLHKRPPPCPHLKHLYFKTFTVPKNVEKYANDVGKSLIRCIQSRQKDSVDQLEHIILKNCPPLPDTWLVKLQELGPDVVTEKDAASVRVIGRNRREIYDDDKISDVEIL